MEMFAPAVRIKRADRACFFLEWARHKRGVWHAHRRMADTRACRLARGVAVWMRATDLEAIERQNYRQVP